MWTIWRLLAVSSLQALGRERKIILYRINLLNSQAEVQSGLQSPSEADWLVHPREEEFRMQVMWRNRRQPRCHHNHCWASEAPLPQHPAPRYPSRERKPPCRLICEKWTFFKYRYMTNTEHCLSVRLDLYQLLLLRMLTNPFVREECNILGFIPLIF